MTPLDPEKDYYFEDGLMVMTEHYHLRRGYCCGSGCRHCPYDRLPESKDSFEDKDPETSQTKAHQTKDPQAKRQGEGGSQ